MLITYKLKLSLLIKNLNKHIKEEFHNTEEHLQVLGLALFIGYILFYFLNSLFFTTTDYENLYLRLIVAILALPILFSKYLPQKLLKYLHIHWYFTLLYCLPFFFTFMLLKNPHSGIWQLNGLVGFTILTLFVGIKSYIFLSCSGILVALSLFYFTSIEFHLPDNFIGMFVSYIPPIAYFLIFSTKQGKIYNEKIRAMKALSGIIAHEMRTPLASIKLAVNGLKSYLPILIKDHHAAIANGFSSEPINPARLNLLAHTLDDIEHLAQGANITVEMILTKLKRIDKNDLEGVYSIADCVNKALDQYKLLEDIEDIINFKPVDDFRFKGNETLIIHVLFNLIKNSVYYIRTKGSGTITIRFKCGDKYNKLIFRDTGTGISKTILTNLFKPFISNTRHGTGLGLAFCKEVMEKINGSITCKSEENLYTEFTLDFPNIEDH
ncbi:MAG: HAMP domain-containing histidine kinase [Sphingobacteriia bacterium]|nr:HAMP domain-containing histidine kinase [Sphingobacteriia bacterium]